MCSGGLGRGVVGQWGLGRGVGGQGGWAGGWGQGGVGCGSGGVRQRDECWGKHRTDTDPCTSVLSVC